LDRDQNNLNLRFEKFIRSAGALKSDIFSIIDTIYVAPRKQD
jgi:hypothetical protein